jgi:Ca2+-binding RTX toxin-like protein
VDQLDGGDGVDVGVIDRTGAVAGSTLDLSGTVAGATITLDNGTTLVNIERLHVTGGGGNDRFLGGVHGDILFGRGGDDFLDGKGGDDILEGGAGNDILSGTDGRDVLRGEAGDDLLSGGDYGFENTAGVVEMDGGEGIDTAHLDMTFSSAANRLDLTDPTQMQTLSDGSSVIRVEKIEYYGGTAADTVTGGALEDKLYGFDGDDILSGAGGDDSIFGGNGDDILDGGAGVNRLDGGDGIDLAVIDRSGATAGITINLFDDPTGARTVLDNGGTVRNVERLSVTGGAGNDFFVGGALADVLNGGGGDDRLEGGNGGDTLRGGTGDDSYLLGDLDGADILIEAAGEGTDTVETRLASYTLLDHFENLLYIGEGSFVGNGNGVANNIVGGSANDIIDGRGGEDLIDLSSGGTDKGAGGADDDGFYLGAAFDPTDVVDGGAGKLDQIGLQGNYGSFGASGTPYTFSATNFTAAADDAGTELLVLLSGNDPRFGDLSGARYSYNLKTADGNVAAGQRLAVSFNTLRADENVRFDGSAEQDGSFLTFGGQGNDEVIGGAGNDDGFFFGAQGRWGSGDKVDGQGGTLDQLGLQGRYFGDQAVAFGADQLSGIEMIVLLTGGDERFGSAGLGYSYDLTMNDGNVVKAASLTIQANTLRADESLTFNGAAETDGRFTINGGLGGDTIAGGRGNDEVNGRGGADIITGGFGADTLRGGDGNDVFHYRATTDSADRNVDRILDFAAGDRIDLAAIDANTANGDGSNEAFTFIGSAAFVGSGASAGQLRAVNNDGVWTIEGDTDGDGAADFLLLVTPIDPAFVFTPGEFIL